MKYIKPLTQRSLVGCVLAALFVCSSPDIPAQQTTITIQAERPAEGAQATFRLAHVDQTYSDLLLVGVALVAGTIALGG